MGVVYKARHVPLKRVVALKMILSGAHAGPEMLARFRAEAEAVARLAHPNIVQIYEIGEYDRLPFFALEFVDGCSLDRWMAVQTPSPRQAAELVETLARAAHAVHQKGVVHRDLKPGNVLLATDGTPKITDFGLAKQLGEEEGRTASGAVLGTPSYMAPEQAAGNPKTIGPATDVHALGAILYELLTGRPPFRAGTPLDTVLQVLEQVPLRPGAYRPDLDASLEAICLKCLEKVPEDRYRSAAALAEDLAAWQRGETVAADRQSSLRLVRILLRDSRHTTVLALWSRVWMCHAGQILALFLLTNVLMWCQVSAAWPYISLWSVGLLSLGWVIWFFRFRNRRIGLTPIEWQLGQVWGLFGVGFLLTGILFWIMGLPILRVLPVVVLECGLGFGCMAAILGGSFHGLGLACLLSACLLALMPGLGPASFGVVFAVGLMIPAWKYRKRGVV
jgi:serine/threonine-protein kinase